jgi:tetratricopeptide (TPR) repeat protein
MRSVWVAAAAMVLVSCAAVQTGEESVARCFNERDLYGADVVITNCSTIIDLRNRPDSDIAAAYDKRGIEYFKRAEYDLALRDYEEALRLNPALASAHNNRGLVYENRRQFDLAIQSFDAAIKLNPRSVAALINRGNAFVRSGEFGRALQNFNQAIALDPTSAAAVLGRGNVYAAASQYNRALDEYDRGIALNPKFALIFANRGWTYIALRQFDLAAADFDEAIRLEPTAARGHAGRACVRRINGAPDAVADIEQARKLDVESVVPALLAVCERAMRRQTVMLYEAPSAPTGAASPRAG